ncbi:MAG: phosphoribosyl transferase domain-containing protein [Parcubacteria group bacterium Gr01-1014_8]|nr:MAG: phosphoribosyl transferase domain-containing protein [Parcubacteria group bacterium Gr01-1014_8]
MFKNRKEAGKEIAQKLASYRGMNAVVLALPRGGVVVGHEVAKALSLPLDIVAVRKIGHPSSPEYAVCALDEHGTRLCNESAIWDIDPAWLAAETERQTMEALRRARVYRGKRLPVEIAGATALLVDDGAATGLTMRAAIAAVRARGVQKIVVAVPVASVDAVRDFTKEADEVVILEPPEEFRSAVGAHFRHFDQVEDKEVVRLLKASVRNAY